MSSPIPERAIIVHTVDHCTEALKAAHALDVPATLCSAPGAAGYAGVLYLKKMIALAAALVPEARYHFHVDCGEDAALAAAALRSAHTHLIFEGAALEKIKSLASRHHASVNAPAAETLDLRFERDIASACKAFLEHAAED